MLAARPPSRACALDHAGLPGASACTGIDGEHLLSMSVVAAADVSLLHDNSLATKLTSASQCTVPPSTH